ncbi:hypothetical protein [Pyrobaculum aerophilum]|uniref:Uncharacterized protein n=1 Tax=Pyrobaculum aerophilum TaxID=13773 RepID=A0A371QX19_9CREN|nr:hypothetical protein [Pyrobaculum aerophilum]RFA94965.1 hypothetical protein CGL51_08740 [Pyrobaculum aerophilum]RFA96286.1 hypothetical protein CGL52_11150 [Pyrobaculum aerophilum]
MAFVIKRGFVEWDFAVYSPEVEKALWEVGVRAALLRRETETSLIAPFVRGVDIKWAEAKGRDKFNVYVYREDVQLIRVNPYAPLTRDQVRAALKYNKYIELPLKPLLSNLPLLAEWLEVLEPEATVFSTPVESLGDVKSPLDVAALLVELSGDANWTAPFKNSLGVLTELVASRDD